MLRAPKIATPRKSARCFLSQANSRVCKRCKVPEAGHSAINAAYRMGIEQTFYRYSIIIITD